MEETGPFQHWNRDTVAFIHLHKTGGTTFHNLLQSCFAEDRICPLRYNELYSKPISMLARYDLFSGHFDYLSTTFIPRKHVRRITILRGPRQRLLSLYRFCRSHLLVEGRETDTLIRLANELDPEDFFEDERITKLPFINNAYLMAFGAAIDDRDTIRAILDGSDVSDQLALAIERVTRLDGLGLTDQFDLSVRQIFGALGLPMPSKIIPEMVTDELPKTPLNMRYVPPIEMTPRLLDSLDRLTTYDRPIYVAATQEFERRSLKETTSRE